MPNKKTFVFLLIVLLHQLVFSQETQKKTYQTQSLSATTPQIDGNITDPAWDNIEWSGEFTQISPYEKREPSQPTAFKILYDDDNLYVAFRCFDSAPDSIENRLSRRDDRQGDWVSIGFDTYHDLRSAFVFSVNSAGVKADISITNDDNLYFDWDAIWTAKTQIDSLGWTAEMQIPLSQLRFGKKTYYTWGLQAVRYLFRKDEKSAWVFIPQNAPGWVHHFGELQGIENINPKKQLDIIPYALGRAERYEKDPENPFATGKDYSASVGLDGKIGVTNDLILDFTINPDFGQVEADPSEVNLTTFETKFAEKRPFFIEGWDKLSLLLLNGGGPYANDNLFYSRRIGHHPSYNPDLRDNEYAKIPTNTTILGAFKLTGKTSKGLSLGIMETLTASENAEMDYLGNRSTQEVEPLSNYFIANISKDLNHSNTKIGGMITATRRDLRTPELQNFMNDEAYSAGINFSHQWQQQTYYLNFSSVYSQIKGSTASLTNTQTNSPYFFQRPDAKYLSLDTNRTVLNGSAGTLQFGKSGNGKWIYGTWFSWRTPGLNINELGYMYTSDILQEVSWVNYRIFKPVGIFRSYSLNAAQWYNTSFGFERLALGGFFEPNTVLKNYWETGGLISHDLWTINTTELRGGPSLRVDNSWDYNVWLASDKRKKIQFSATYSAGFRKNDVFHYNNYFLGANFRVTDAFEISLEPGYRQVYDELAYVNNNTDISPERYIRGTLKQNQVELTLRFTYNISPDFTIQYYGMPFISSGEYVQYKYITQSLYPEFSERFTTYTDNQINYDANDDVYMVNEGINSPSYQFDNPNFNVMDFNSNLVIRWEYMPGSTFYLVWSQNRNDYATLGDFDLHRDLNNLFDSYPHDVFLIKLSYRIGR